ncbi:MAG TPA: hypothetical protein P5121_12380 [Caldilineaceae bacterium]|nr:hypothetical protein [Caldilineaceae bacterium]
MQRIKQIGSWVFLLLLIALVVAGGSFLWGAYMLPPHRQVSSTLALLYEQDQAARQAGFADLKSFLTLTLGDWQRLQKVRRMVDAQLLATTLDHYHAALLLQHGHDPNDFRRAQQLAEQAAQMGEPRGIKLSALAEDRYLISMGQPQRYGSQFVCTPPQGWQLQPVGPAVTDADREQKQMPPLAEQRAKVAEIQTLTSGQCALTADTMHEIAQMMEE